MSKNYLSWANKEGVFVIGKDFPYKIIRFFFKGWLDAALEATYHGDILFLEEKYAAGRAHIPYNPHSPVVCRLYYEPETSEGIINVEYDPAHSSPERIEEWFKKMGIDAERAAPFERPVFFTTWRAVQRKKLRAFFFGE